MKLNELEARIKRGDTITSDLGADLLALVSLVREMGVVLERHPYKSWTGVSEALIEYKEVCGE